MLVHFRRYENIIQAVGQIAADVDLSGKQHVLIKPNFVVTHKPLAATHVDAVRAVLDFVRSRYEGRRSGRRPRGSASTATNPWSSPTASPWPI